MPRNEYIIQDILEAEESASTVTSDIMDIRRMDGLAVVCQCSNSAPAAKDFEDGDVSVGDDEITEVGHGYLTGAKGQLTTTGTLPAGLSLLTDYFIIKVNDDTFKLAETLAKAEADDPVDITDASGGGTHTFTPSALDMTVKYQGSIDRVTFVDVATQSISTSCNILFNVDRPHYLWARVQFEHEAGQSTVQAKAAIESE